MKRCPSCTSGRLRWHVDADDDGLHFFRVCDSPTCGCVVKWWPLWFPPRLREIVLALCMACVLWFWLCVVLRISGAIWPDGLF